MDSRTFVTEHPHAMIRYEHFTHISTLLASHMRRTALPCTSFTFSELALCSLSRLQSYSYAY
jgi:hypothetical protein